MPHQPHCSGLCAFHARKEAQALSSEKIGREIAYLFSGRYLSACDLNAALGCLFAAVAQGQIKPKVASTLAYLAQTMLQTIQVAQDEYRYAFGNQDWGQNIRASVKSNHDYRLLNVAPNSLLNSADQDQAQTPDPPEQI
jgi:hypothetical protein